KHRRSRRRVCRRRSERRWGTGHRPSFAAWPCRRPPVARRRAGSRARPLPAANRAAGTKGPRRGQCASWECYRCACEPTIRRMAHFTRHGECYTTLPVARLSTRLQLVGVLRELVRELRREIECLVFVDPMLDREGGQKPAVDAPRNIMPRRDREERAGIVVESDGVVETRGLRRLLPKTQHAFGTVMEPPWGTELQHRIMTRERRELARVHGLVQREQDDREI